MGNPSTLQMGSRFSIMAQNSEELVRVMKIVRGRGKIGKLAIIYVFPTMLLHMMVAHVKCQL